MTITVTHAFVSGKADNADPTEVNPSNWNAQHTLTLATNNILGRASAGTGQVEEVPCTEVARTLLAASTQLAMRAAMGQALTADIGALQVTGAQIANGTITATQLAGITAQSMAVSALGVNAPINAGLTAGVSGGALTITLTDNAAGTPSLTSPVDIVFRDATSSLPAVGLPVLRQVTSALSLVIPSGATMGVTVNGTPFCGWIIAIDNSGTVELGVAVCTTAAMQSGVINNEGALIGATAISGSSTLAGTVYATTGVSTKAFRVIGYFEYAAGLASAGVYSIPPTTLKLYGPGDKKPGDLVSRFYLPITAATTTMAGSTYTPSATPPTTSNGQLIASQAIVPTSTTSLLRVGAQLFLGTSATASVDYTVFITQDAVATSLAANSIFTTVGNTHTMNCGVFWQGVSKLAVSTTFNIYAAPSAGVVNVNTIAAGAAFFGGAIGSYLVVEEYKA